MSSLFGIEMGDETQNTTELKTIVQKNKITAVSTKTKKPKKPKKMEKTETKKLIPVVAKKPVKKAKMKKASKVVASKKAKKKITARALKITKKVGGSVKSKKTGVKKSPLKERQRSRVCELINRLWLTA